MSKLKIQICEIGMEYVEITKIFEFLQKFIVKKLFKLDLMSKLTDTKW